MIRGWRLLISAKRAGLGLHSPYEPVPIVILALYRTVINNVNFKLHSDLQEKYSGVKYFHSCRLLDQDCLFLDCVDCLSSASSVSGRKCA